MYSQEYDYTHYTSADLCGFGRVVAKSLVVYYDLADEVDRVRDAMTETDEDFKWRSNLVGMRSRIVQDLETKLSRQYDFRNKQRRGGEEAFGTRRAEKTRNEHFSKEMDSDADAGLGDDIPFDLPDSDVDSVGSDSEPRVREGAGSARGSAAGTSQGDCQRAASRGALSPIEVTCGTRSERSHT